MSFRSLLAGLLLPLAALYTLSGAALRAESVEQWGV